MRVLAVTTNASLVVALGSMMREWEVVTVRDVDRAAEEGTGSSVALIDLGETDAGIQMADQLYHRGITIPCVVVGDKSADDARAWVLVRPFSLEELGAAVREAAAGPARAYEEPAAPSRGNGTRSAAPPRAPEVERAKAPRSGPRAVREPEPVPEPEPVTLEEPEEEAQPEEELASEPGWEPDAEPVAETWTQPERAAPAWTGPAEVPAPPQPDRAPEPAGGRWKLRRRSGREGPEPAVETPLVRRLKIAAAQARELEHLVAQLPFLADLGAMADGLIGEIDRQFVCAVASVSVLRDEGYEVVAHRGLSRVEAGMVVPPTQSLFSDVLKTREGILIQPVDLAQGLVAGIGGARTEAIMVAPAMVEGECIAVVMVGGDRFGETDLDRLSALAAEAAPGLAVAQLLDRLRGHASY